MRIDLPFMMVVSCAAALSFAGPASAQTEGADETDSATTDTGDAGTGDAASGMSATDDPYGGSTEEGVAEEAAPPTTGGYPIAEIDRPLVLPVMMLEVRGGFSFSRLAIDLPAPLTSISTNSIGLFAGGGFGVMPGLEAGIGGGFFTSGPGLGLFLLLSPDIDIGDLPLYGMYDLTELIGVPNLQIAGRLSFNLPIQSQFSVLADAPVKYKVTDMVAVIGSAGLGAQIGDGTNGLLILINAGALVQATEQVAVSATIGMLARAGGGSPVLIPLAVRGEFNIMEPIDVFAEFSFVDLNNFGPDWILIQGGVAYRLGF